MSNLKLNMSLSLVFGARQTMFAIYYVYVVVDAAGRLIQRIVSYGWILFSAALSNP